MNNDYKYDPENFKGMLGLTQELKMFYKLYESYAGDKTDRNRFALENHWENLFFTIKHREVEGFLDPLTAQEIRDYLEELMHDG